MSTPNPAAMSILVTSRAHGDARGVFDAGDATLVLAHTWHAQAWGPRSLSPRKMYLATCVRVGGRMKRVFLHRLIMGEPVGMQIDHIDGNPLNNRRVNLRIVTARENRWNVRDERGYTWRPRHAKWEARIKVGGKGHLLGLFTTEEDARAAYLTAKKRLHPITARGLPRLPPSAPG